MTEADEILMLETEAVAIRAAMSALLAGGQSYTYSSGGSSRTVTLVDYQYLNIRLKEITLRLRELAGTAGLKLGVGW